VKFLPGLLAASWVYKALKITQKSGRLLPHRFHHQKLAVYSLLHYPLGYPSHFLNGTILHCSPDFPLEHEVQAII